MAEKEWFHSFVVGDMDDFHAYIEEKRQDRVWGDDPEIQALCEIYDRAAEIYAYDPVLGAKRLRTFHSGRSVTRPPVKLSYYGGGHYDSITGPSWEPALLRLTPGEAERRFLARVEARRHRPVGVVCSGVCACLAVPSWCDTCQCACAKSMVCRRRIENWMRLCNCHARRTMSNPRWMSFFGSRWV